MMAQKNHKNKTTIVHRLPKKMIDFELCGGAYPKFGMKIHRPEGGA